ncbi:hypothetical protein [Flavobacterium sp.]|uniref:hypothetical protein n=1 Tax=Flavobacterium sp. TaxID=239 RepID=UPI0038FC0299
MKKQDLTKLSKSDELSILAIQEEVLEELEKKQSLSRDNGRFQFNQYLLTTDRRKQIRKSADKILEKYRFQLVNAAAEMVDYDKDGLINFININLPARIKQDNEEEEYEEYLRLKKKFEK